ncbi:hypothetical protein FA09DRAFT_135599 [Tilletiopsis washingtonensis]|uniref:Uncharacterized protein n=1 Tax=Tilletiopsis washingtonensis TaxID=58919 RepID=A0A316Z408_9BASI|nr:hypothetical protein FA09DRAFT_135599 [Tilletiopsis washingtonensis]PWN95642.1 hypothetical protein FA09DRAFT_135599 [Tilletiopsis washingtonensis]
MVMVGFARDGPQCAGRWRGRASSRHITASSASTLCLVSVCNAGTMAAPCTQLGRRHTLTSGAETHLIWDVLRPRQMPLPGSAVSVEARGRLRVWRARPFACEEHRGFGGRAEADRRCGRRD